MSDREFKRFRDDLTACVTAAIARRDEEHRIAQATYRLWSKLRESVVLPRFSFAADLLNREDFNLLAAVRRLNGGVELNVWGREGSRILSDRQFSLSFSPSDIPYTVEMKKTIPHELSGHTHTFSLKHDEFAYYVGLEIDEFVRFMLGVKEED